MGKMLLKIITPNGIMFEDEILSLHVTSTNGDLTLLPSHYPLVTGIIPSVFHFETKNGVIKAFTGQGILRVGEKSTSLIVSSFNLKDDIDIERARRSLERAKNRLSSNKEGLDIERAKSSLLRAEARIKLWEGH